MSRLSRVKHEFVDFIPERLEEGVLYVSRRYHTASHLCCCGCGLEVVTPLNEAKWQVMERDGGVWLRPSIGNWSFPCQSHYWIEGNRIRWSGKMSANQIAAVRRRDRHDAERLVARGRPAARFLQGFAVIWAKVVRMFKSKR